MLFGINFNLYYFVLIGRVKEALKSEELHVYFTLIGVSVLAITLGIAKMYGGFATALRHAFFNTMSIVSTAGFGTVDFTTWPDYCQSILVILMFIGGCAGSTGGGLKLSRVMLLVKTAVADVQRMVSPRRVTRIELDGRRVSQETASAVYTYFALYMLILLGCVPAPRSALPDRRRVRPERRAARQVQGTEALRAAQGRQLVLHELLRRGRQGRAVVQ